MKQLKTVLIIALLLMSALSDCLAQGMGDGDTLYVYTKTCDEAARYLLDDVNKMTFSSKGVQLWITNWPTEYPYENVRFLTFKTSSNEPSTVRNLSNTEGKISIGYNASNCNVTVMSDILLDCVAVYDVQGQAISEDKSKRQVYNLSLKNAPYGVYVIKAFGIKKGICKKIVKH